MRRGQNIVTGTLLASAPSITALHECITAFYGGEGKILIEDGPNSWEVWNKSMSRRLEGVYVQHVKGRYHFRMN